MYCNNCGEALEYQAPEYERGRAYVQELYFCTACDNIATTEEVNQLIEELLHE